MRGLVVAVPVAIVNAVLLVFFVPLGSQWSTLLGMTGVLFAMTMVLYYHQAPTRRGTAQLMFLGGLVPQPLIWLSLLDTRNLRVLGWAGWLVYFAFFAVAMLYQFVHRPRKGRCAQCNYDLTGNVSGRCPECGTPIPGAPLETWTEPEDETKR